MTKQLTHLIAVTDEQLQILKADHIGDRFKASIAIELLRGRLATMETHFAENRISEYVREDWEDYVRGAEFLNSIGVSSFDTNRIIDIKQHINTL